MKYKILFLSLFTYCSLSAQNDLTNAKSSNKLPSYEIKFNPVFALLSLPEISYERILSEKNSIGLAVSYATDQDDLDVDFQILPYYRFFLGKRKNATGFFLEANVSYFKETSSFREFRGLPENGFGVGAAIGYKLLKTNGLTVDFIAGLGKNLITKGNLSPYFPRFGFSIGKRFSAFSERNINYKEQTQNEYFKNEFRVNLAYTAYGIPELTYERILKKSSSIGLSFAYSFSDKIDQKFFLLPHYRFYFGEQVANGFFVELGAMFWQAGERYSSFNGKDIGVGGEVAIGFKLTKLPNFPIELVTGFGRSFINKDELYETFAPRLGLSIGRRF